MQKCLPKERAVRRMVWVELTGRLQLYSHGEQQSISEKHNTLNFKTDGIKQQKSTLGPVLSAKNRNLGL